MSASSLSILDYLNSNKFPKGLAVGCQAEDCANGNENCETKGKIEKICKIFRENKGSR